jgi:hypothetical protein
MRNDNAALVRAFDAMTPHNKAAALRAMASTYLARYEREGNPADLNHANHLNTEAALYAPLDPYQATEAAAFTLSHTQNQPRTTTAQTALF